MLHKNVKNIAGVMAVALSLGMTAIAPAQALVVPEGDEIRLAAASLEQQVAAEQAQLKAQNHMQIVDYSGSDMENKEGPLAYLMFSKDYAGNEPAHVFTGKDFIYAHLKLPQPISQMLPKKAADETHAKVQYYRIKLKTTVNGRSQENAIKVQRGNDFATAYSSPHLQLAVVPEKGFFESLLEPYRKDGQFKSAVEEHKALGGLLARNFSRQMSYLYKNLSPGEHKVNMDLEITAKLQGSKFVQLKNIKGVYALKVDDEAKSRYDQTFNMLTQLYRDYEAQYSIAGSRLTEAKEEEMLAKMTPRERERFLIAKRSPLGYLAAYKGPKIPVRFVFGKLRNKNAYVDVVWPEGSCSGCEKGTSSLMVSNQSKQRSVQLPPGTRISINGRTLVPQLQGQKTVNLYWFY